MKQLPITPELRPIAEPANRRPETPVTAWDRMVAAISNSDQVTVVICCIIAGLLAVNLFLRFPDAGLTVEQINQLPLWGP